MAKLKRIVCSTLPSLTDQDWRKIEALSGERPARIDSEKLDPAALPSDTDGLLVSLHTDVPRGVVDALPALRYIGVLGTSTGRVDLAACRERGITVTRIGSYCDHETAEFVIAEMLAAARGLHGAPQWRHVPHSVAGKTLGILGLGKVGSEVARMAQALGMRVSHHSLTRRPELEARGITYASREALLGGSDFVSVHLPPHERRFSAGDFAAMRPGTVWINTSMGDVFDPSDLRRWLTVEKNLAIVDSIAARQLGDFEHPRLIRSDQRAYWTAESLARLHRTFIGNLEGFLADQPQ